jgi:hypothetical protein
MTTPADWLDDETGRVLVLHRSIEITRKQEANDMLIQQILEFEQFEWEVNASKPIVLTVN